ncbi:mandelate racemase [Salinibacterium xinjiangense]|uniref:L-alanine-DL-glutamate epimerase n=1 Tax=Salinibacterium xinjiangense TaxID=386302 RepID=A0A2C8Z622_9MICO|nr:mandelate racemase/muconate lactonizing enzyme family protein [Salinibacterium xinjiangense]GGK92801.1 mandelate racemase [Salinibacterium xinjiangense]SOE59234.1 L-alanine-DL-glutamate epimerase [Salinibacterium xinjiangense]
MIENDEMAGVLPSEISTAMMPRITAVETIRTPLQSNVTFVAIHDDAGNTGLGETFYGSTSVEAYIHDVAVPLLREHRGPTSPAKTSRLLSGYVGYSGSGSEVRGNSAIDIALWDLLAKRAALPLRELLGGPTRESISTYNTCAGNDYVNAQSRQSSSNWGIGLGSGKRYEDLEAFLTRPGELAQELLGEGYTGMKVWPFDLAAEASAGDHKTSLDFGLHVLDEIRNAVGDAMDLYLELHSLWTLRGAGRLVKALEPFELAWIEDPLRADHSHALHSLKQSTNIPIAVGESIGGGLSPYRALLDTRSIDIAIVDLGWSGGITPGLKTASIAEQYGIPIAPHDCTGPVALAVATHFVTAIPNGYVQEVARAFYHGWYHDIADGLPVIADGAITPAKSAGHGVVLRDEFLSSPATIRRISNL